MQHAWIFDVLQDIRAYSEMNDLPELIPYIDAAYDAALKEISPNGNVILASEMFATRVFEKSEREA